MDVLNEAIKAFLSVESGCGDGCGSGCGNGYGCGDGSGCGNGCGNGYGIKSFNSHPVYYIDNVATVLTNVRNNLAIGFIINADLTTEKCYVVKSGNLFAHGSTIKEAENALQDKIFDNLEVDEKIDAFLDEFELDRKYPAKLFYEWHHKLTGSCKFGRDAFVKNHDIDLEKGMYTVSEFIEITENDYGGSIIQQIKERIC